LVSRGGDAEAEGGGGSWGDGGGCGGDGPGHDRWGLCGGGGWGGVRRAILAGERRISKRKLVYVYIETAAPPRAPTAAAAAARFAGEGPGVSGREGGGMHVAIALSAGRRCEDAGGGWGGCGLWGGGGARYVGEGGGGERERVDAGTVMQAADEYCLSVGVPWGPECQV
jgi:hypothetical protein